MSHNIGQINFYHRKSDSLLHFETSREVIVMKIKLISTINIHWPGYVIDKIELCTSYSLVQRPFIVYLRARINNIMNQLLLLTALFLDDVTQHSSAMKPKWICNMTSQTHHFIASDNPDQYVAEYSVQTSPVNERLPLGTRGRWIATVPSGCPLVCSLTKKYSRALMQDPYSRHNVVQSLEAAKHLTVKWTRLMGEAHYA